MNERRSQIQEIGKENQMKVRQDEKKRITKGKKKDKEEDSHIIVKHRVGIMIPIQNTMSIPDAEIFKVEEGVRVVLADDLDESASERKGGSVGFFGMRER